MIKHKKKALLKIYSKEKTQLFQRKIDLLGTKKSYDATIFLNIRLFTTIFLFFMLLYLFDMGYILAPIGAIAYYNILPIIVIDNQIKKRIDILDNEAMYFFEVLTLSLETGRNLKNALELTANNIDSTLADEFKETLNEVRYGKSLTEALESLKLRIPSDTINNIILNISQSNIFGNSIIETLYNQIDYIRDRQVLKAKANISKVPLKVSVISVIFFIPLILLLILSPVIINFFS